MKSTQNLPSRLKELRNKNNYSQEQLAEILNVSRQAVSRWENGKAVPDIDNILIMSELYDVPVDELFDVEYHSDNANVDEDNIKNGSASIIENLILAVVLVLSSEWYIIGIPVTLGISIWLLYTKRHYKFVFALCILCFAANLYEIFVLYTHFNIFYGGWRVYPK